MHDGGPEKENRAVRTVAMIGLGYVGLPLALLFVRKGFRVLGVDLDSRKIKRLRGGRSYITDIPDVDIQAALDSGRFVPSSRYGAIRYAEAVIVCVPTPLTGYGTPDISYLTQAAVEIGCRLRTGQLVVLESSTYPGTTREAVLPLLKKSGLKAGTDFHLAYSPERIDPGNSAYPVEDIPKIVSGITPACLVRVEELYSKVFASVYPVSSTEAAELTKLLEDSHRLVNISFMNELAIVCDVLKLDIWEVIEAAKTKPFGFTAFYPGPGVGGHCIPVDPSYLQWKLMQYETGSEFIRVSNDVNHRMPQYIAEQIERLLKPKRLENACILVYGAAYKKDVADSRESASIELLQLLIRKRANVSYHDPYIPAVQIGGQTIKSVELTAESLSMADCVVILTDHSGIPLSLMMEHAPLIYDTRNVTAGLRGKARTVRLGGGDPLP